MKLLICGDIIFNYNRFIDNDFFDSSIEQFILGNKYDFISANLEGPLTENDSAISKNGPSLRYDKSYINFLLKLKINLVTLANNHIMDYGIKGFRETISILGSNNINYIGIKKDGVFNNIFYLEKDGIRIAFYSLCENEFSSWTRFGEGAYTLNIVSVINDIKLAKEKCDYLIVLFHGGRERYRYPTPWNQQICRFFIDHGADFVFEQHSHIIGSKEVYKNGIIIYGQGDFINKRAAIEKNAVIFELEITKTSLTCKPVLLNRESENKTIEYVKDEGKLFSSIYSFPSEDSEVKNKYLEWLSQNSYSIFYQLLRKNKLYQLVDIHLLKNKLIRRTVRKNKKYLLLLFNLINCETHREALIMILEEVIK